jgi:adenylyltransferase/sulfurtransferase
LSLADSEESRDRYSRQIRFAPLGAEGQRALGRGSAVVVGAGALGSHAASGLVRAGVGRVRVVDRDYVEWSNLARQELFDEEDARGPIPKAVAAERRLREINSDVAVEGVIADLTPATSDALLGGAGVIVDGTDNFETRFLVNDWALKNAVPWVYGACVGSMGTLLVVAPGEGPCLRCVFEEPPAPGSTATCETAGILGSTAGAVAALEVVEAMKILGGRNEAVLRDLVEIDVWEGTFRRINVAGAAACPACADGRYEWLEGGRVGGAEVLCGRNAVQVLPSGAGAIDFGKIAQRLGAAGHVTRNEFLLRFEGGGYRITVFADGRAMVEGTADPAEARAAYAKYVGA